MPLWLQAAIWILWLILAFDELRLALTIHRWNSNPIRTGLRGRASRSLYGRISFNFLWVFTAVWFSWVLFH